MQILTTAVKAYTAVIAMPYSGHAKKFTENRTTNLFWGCRLFIASRTREASTQKSMSAGHGPMTYASIGPKGSSWPFLHRLVFEDDGLTLSFCEIISCIHKMMRRNLTPQLCYLLRGFFEGMQLVVDKHECTPEKTSTATAVTNRFAIAMVEEGVLGALRHSSDLRSQACTLLEIFLCLVCITHQNYTLL